MSRHTPGASAFFIKRQSLPACVLRTEALCRTRNLCCIDFVQAISMACIISTLCRNPFNANCSQASGPGAGFRPKCGIRIGIAQPLHACCHASPFEHTLWPSASPFSNFAQFHQLEEERRGRRARECLSDRPIGVRTNARNVRLAAGMDRTSPRWPAATISPLPATTKLPSRRVASHIATRAHAVVC